MKLHLILQGKGGIGKTLFARFKVERFDLLDGPHLIQHRMDQWFRFLDHNTDDIVVDSGASTFLPLADYLVSQRLPALFKEMGYELIVHTVIAGSGVLADTLQGFESLVRQFPASTKLTVWLNPFRGPIENEGRSFYEMKPYLDYRERVDRVINLPVWRGRTFEEVIQDPEMFTLTRQRLMIMREELYEIFDQADWRADDGHG